MTTLTTSPRRSAPADLAGAGQRELRSRGRLILTSKVVEKVAGQAATEVGAARGRSGGVLGIGSKADSNARPKVEVELAGEFADLAIAVGIAYPGSIRGAAQRIRNHVAARVHDLTGVRVRSVDVDVTFLTLDIQPDKEALQ